MNLKWNGIYYRAEVLFKYEVSSNLPWKKFIIPFATCNQRGEFFSQHLKIEINETLFHRICDLKISNQD